MNHLCGFSNSLIHTLSLDTTLTREAPYRPQSEQSVAVHWLIFSRTVFLSHTVSHAITLIACSLPPLSPNSHKNTRSVFPTLAAFHWRTQSTADWVICDGGVKAPNRDILAHCVYPGWYSDTEQNTLTHILYRKRPSHRLQAKAA